ncbi:MAG: hypothetical protein JWL93_916 [Hyphomicrobiales bacterium]|nr:hypothetical protein [Hyphomicrobiales bacterium]
MQELDRVPSFRRLRAFEATARTGSVSAAALELRLSQPAVTQSINLLEAQLGARLFDRSQDGSFLTEAGTIFRRRTARFFEQTGAAVKAAIHPNLAAESELVARKIGDAEARAVMAVWQEGSFRAAARRLAVSEPSLQRPARQLESLLGSVLYRRSSTGLSVNERGADLARRMALAIGEIRSGREEIGAAESLRASLRIGVLALSPRTLLAEATGALMQAFPLHRIEVIEGPYSDLATALHDGAIDLMYGALRTPPPFADLMEEELFEDPYSIVCRRDHPLTQLTHIRTKDLARHAWVFPNEGLPRRAVLNDFIAARKLQAPVQIETSCLATIVALLTTSDRISLLSRWHIALDGHADLARVEGVRIDHPRRCVGLTTRTDWLPTPVQDAFLSAMRKAAGRVKRAEDSAARSRVTAS